SYAYAQKMRAAISHKFSRELGRGTQPWIENPYRPGMYGGNPSLSFPVSQYMISLRRRKTRQGEAVTSARAVSEDVLRRLFEFNHYFAQEEFGPVSRKRKATDESMWAGRAVRTMLNAVYIIAFLCLLRFDKALRMEWHWITLEEHGGSVRIKIELPFRKTHQTGGIAPFYLYANPAKPWLDPVLALSRWIACNDGMPLKGYVCRRKNPSGRFSEDPEHGMSAESFLSSFCQNLLDIGVDPRLYGTHSFRRGGCQYLATEVRWPIRKICAWGGWSENQDTGTIFKYLLSWTDETLNREDYFNPAMKRGKDYCSACGRSCLCA
ncbi:hypothetical protein BV25DRAFT_1812085, partial [Artomyces pyxidatus]